MKAELSIHIDEINNLKLDIVRGDSALLSIINRYYSAKKQYEDYDQSKKLILDFGIVLSLVNQLEKDTTLLMETTTNVFTRECLKIIKSELLIMQGNFDTDVEEKMSGYRLINSLFSSITHRIAVLESCATKNTA